jgi:CHAT domain-containing protein
MEDRFNASEALIRTAKVQQNQGTPKRATENAERALKNLRGTGASYALANAKHSLAELYRESGRLDEALELHSQLEDSTLLDQGPELAWREALSRGRTFEAVQRKKAALSSFQSAIETIESVRSRLGEKGLREGYLADRSQPYLELTRLSLELGQTDRAFLNSERLRARSYSDLVVEDSSLADEGPQKRKVFEFRERIRQLRNSIKQERGLPPEEQRPQAVAYLLDKLTSAELEYREFLKAFAEDDPEYERILNLSVPSVAEMMARVPSDAALVEYLVGTDECFVFVLRRSGLHAARIPLARRDLVTRVELFRDLVQREGSSSWTSPGQKLHELLIQPLEEAGWLSQVRKLFIVPHEVLHYLPFSALGPDSEGRFLVERYLIVSVPSASSLLTNPGQEAPKSVLAMAPERSMLEFARAEAEGIAREFPAPKQVLLGKAAGESEFKSQASDYRVLHIATHATFNKWNPLLSALELEPGENDDGNLTVLEILALNLRADLVTLSACDTAIAGGQFSVLPPGDDFVGLTRAFQFAGAREVLATLWEVDDQSTSDAMTRFYAERKQTNSVRALAEVQRSMIGQKDALSHPRHWAPFVIVDTSP